MPFGQVVGAGRNYNFLRYLSAVLADVILHSGLCAGCLFGGFTFIKLPNGIRICRVAGMLVVIFINCRCGYGCGNVFNIRNVNFSIAVSIPADEVIFAVFIARLCRGLIYRSFAVLDIAVEYVLAVIVCHNDKVFIDCCLDGDCCIALDSGHLIGIYVTLVAYKVNGNVTLKADFRSGLGVALLNGYDERALAAVFGGEEERVNRAAAVAAD